GELNKPILARYNEQKAKELAEKLAKEEAERIQAELDAAIIAEVKSTVRLGYEITVCDNNNLSTQLDKLLSQLSDKYQEKLGLPTDWIKYKSVVDSNKDYDPSNCNYDFLNLSVTELKNGKCEFTAFIGTDIIQFTFNGHSSVNADIVKDIDNAINSYIKTGKIKQKSGKKPALKIADKHNKSAKRSKEAIALATMAKELRNTYTVKPTERSPLERMISDMVRVVSINGYLQVIAVDKFDSKGEYESNTIKTFTVGQTVRKVDLAVSKVMLSEILEIIGNTNISDITFSQNGNNLVITHPKGEYELVGLDSSELITLFHPDEVTETTPVVETTTIDITEGDNYILPTTQVVKLVETIVDDVICCEVVGSNKVAEVTEVNLDDIVGIDLIDSQLFTVLTEVKPEVKPETTEFNQQITPIGDTDKKGYTQSNFFIKTTKGYEKRTGFIKGQIAIRNEINFDVITHIPSGERIADLNTKNVINKSGKRITKKEVLARSSEIVDSLNQLSFISKSELNKTEKALIWIYSNSIIRNCSLEDATKIMIECLDPDQEHEIIESVKTYFNIIDS
ncbi:MAG TPA: hypothetical protein V6C58_23695, partial [Allocoleopsis sp.]